MIVFQLDNKVKIIMKLDGVLYYGSYYLQVSFSCWYFIFVRYSKDIS